VTAKWKHLAPANTYAEIFNVRYSTSMALRNWLVRHPPSQRSASSRGGGGEGLRYFLSFPSVAFAVSGCHPGDERPYESRLAFLLDFRVLPPLSSIRSCSFDHVDADAVGCESKNFFLATSPPPIEGGVPTGATPACLSRPRPSTRPSFHPQPVSSDAKNRPASRDPDQLLEIPTSFQKWSLTPSLTHHRSPSHTSPIGLHLFPAEPPA
jgi:hypothetical protein